MLPFFAQYFENIHSACKTVDNSFLEAADVMIRRVVDRNAKIIIAGNGGSAAIASHVAVDFTKAAGIRAINFNESDLITCFANDYGYENWVAKAIDFYAIPDDLVILISSSGTSPNIINAAKQAKHLGLDLITLSGFSDKNPLRTLGDINAWVPSDQYNVIEMTHHIWLLAILDFYISTEQNK